MCPNIPTTGPNISATNKCSSSNRFNKHDLMLKDMTLLTIRKTKCFHFFVYKETAKVMIVLPAV